ncbi:MAG: hypothetical protein KIT18_00285 [Burkholderiales bacterium]|nr:hypothetical protein [Burkholderiales bacterium]
MVNARGERFVRRGRGPAGLYVFTNGREILAQPGMFAWQIFDQRAVPSLRDEYRIRQATKVVAPTLEGPREA